MKALKILLSIMVLSFFVCVRANAEEKVNKMAYVDLSRLFDAYQKTKDYDAALGTKQKTKEDERAKKIQEIKDLQQKLTLVNDKDKEKLQGQVDEKTKALQEFERSAQTDLRKQRDDLLKEILKEIEKTISDYAQKENYTIIFNDRVLLYSDPQLDISEPLIKILNEKYNSKKK